MNNISGEQLCFLPELLLYLSFSFITPLYLAIPLQVKSNNAGLQKVTLEIPESPPSNLCDGHGGLLETSKWRYATESDR